MAMCSPETWRLVTMLVLTFGFFLVEITVGYITNSVALVADSFHMLSDVVALMIGLAALRISKWPSRRNTFGWVRAEVLGALVNSVFLLALCFTILLESLRRLLQVEHIQRPILLLVVGSLGLLVNLLGLVLFHSHGHDHPQAINNAEGTESSKDKALGLLPDSTENGEKPAVIFEIVNKSDSKSKRSSAAQMNLKGVFLHVLGDALGSVVVIVTSVIVWKAEGQWRFYVDPAMSFAMVVLIFTTTVPLLKQSSMILLQTPPDFIDQHNLKLQLNKVEGVLGVHEFHVWQLTGNRIVLSAHITCTNKEEYMRIATVVKDLFHKEGIHSTTIQPEFVATADLPDMNRGGDDDQLGCRLLCSDLTPNCLKDSCCDPKAAQKQRKRRARGLGDTSSSANSPANSAALTEDRAVSGDGEILRTHSQDPVVINESEVN